MLRAVCCKMRGEAAGWLSEHGVASGGAGGATLAELFARANGDEVEREKPVGFSG